MAKSAGSVFVIKHSTQEKQHGCRVKKVPKCEKLSDIDLKKITSNLEKNGVAWVYLPPGITSQVVDTADCCIREHEDDEDDDD